MNINIWLFLRFLKVFEFHGIQHGTHGLFINCTNKELRTILCYLLPVGLGIPLLLPGMRSNSFVLSVSVLGDVFTGIGFLCESKHFTFSLNWNYTFNSSINPFISMAPFLDQEGEN